MSRFERWFYPTYVAVIAAIAIWTWWLWPPSVGVALAVLLGGTLSALWDASSLPKRRREWLSTGALLIPPLLLGGNQWRAELQGMALSLLAFVLVYWWRINARHAPAR